MFKNVSFCETLKFEKVTGNNNKAEAKIAGITPAEFIFNGKCKTHHHTSYYPFAFLDN